MSIVCPVECVRAACPDPDFLEKNGAWLLTVIGLFVGCLATVMTYFLKSRCRTIDCCGVSLERDVIEITKPASATIDTNFSASK